MLVKNFQVLNWNCIAGDFSRHKRIALVVAILCTENSRNQQEFSCNHKTKKPEGFCDFL